MSDEGEWWWCPSHSYPWISLGAVPKDFYGIPDYLGKYTSSSFSIGSKACQKVFKPGQIHGIARNLNVRIHKPQISAVMLFSNLPKCQYWNEWYVYMFCCECLVLVCKKFLTSPYPISIFEKDSILKLYAICRLKKKKHPRRHVQLPIYSALHKNLSRSHMQTREWGSLIKRLHSLWARPRLSTSE